MQRAATAVFLGGWAGFLAVSTSISAMAVMRTAEIEVPVPTMLAEPVEVLARTLPTGGNAGLLIVMLASLVAVVLAATLMLALWIIMRMNEEDRRFGERLALAGLAATGTLLCAANLVGSPVFAAAGALSSLLIVLALSGLAVLFDRLVEDDEDEAEDDEGFRAALSLIGQEMARDAARHATSTRDRNR